jgi:hypothetical protein
MRYRMHKRVETKPDGRKIYYYTFEAVETPQGGAPRDCHSAPAPRVNAEPSRASASSERRT